jgi:hypothetical protein
MIDEEIDPRLEEHLRNVLRTIAGDGGEPIRSRRSRQVPALRVAAAALVVVAVAGVVITRGTDRNEPLISPQPTSASPVTTESTEAPTTSEAPSTTANAAAGALRPVAIGDQVMIAAKPELEARGVTVDAAENRHPADFIAELRALRSSGGIGDTVVIQVGTNAAVTDEELDQIVALLPRSLTPNLVFMTVRAPVPWIAGNNTRITALPARYPWIKILDWEALSAGTELCPDGIHVTCSIQAKQFYATTILDAISSTGHDQTAS